MRVVIDGVGEHAMRVVIDGVGEQSAGYLHVRLAAGERDEVHVAHTGLEAEDLLPVAAREHTHLPSEGSFAPSEAIRGNQRWCTCHPRGHSRHQRQSEAIRGGAPAILGHPRPSEAYRVHQCPSVSISAHQRSSEALRGTQRHSEALRGTQRAISGSRARTEPSAAPTSSAFPSGAQCTHETCPRGCGTTYTHWPASVSHAFS